MAKILPITIYPDKKLRQKSTPLKFDEPTILKRDELCADMALTMLTKDGVGLAAPQVGLNIRMIAINTKNGVKFLFNPKIIKKSLFREWGEEGCLSVPNIFGQVKRSKNITYEYLDKNGHLFKEGARGFMARVIQHEIDHLDGILFIDHAQDLKEVLKN